MQIRRWIRLYYILLLASCSRIGHPMNDREAKDLRNAAVVVQSLGGNTIQLKDGVYESRAEQKQVSLVDSLWRGDINGDGVSDAAGLLAVNSGGSGQFVELVVFLNTNGNLLPIPTLLLGDRVRVKSVRIDSGKISLAMIVQGENEPLCCPTLHVSRSFVVEHGKLVSADWPRTFHCAGTEPFWGIQISDSTILFSSPEQRERWRYENPIFFGMGLGYMTRDLAGNRVSIVIRRGNCSDGMSERAYPYSVTVTRGTSTLRGCAYSE